MKSYMDFDVVSNSDINYKPECNGWENITDISIAKFCNLVGLT